METWKAASYDIAVAGGPSEVSGYIHLGLGLHIQFRASHRTKNKNAHTWSLTHLNTGHRITALKGDIATVFPLATEMAECADWDFIGLTGYENQDPEIISKLEKVLRKHGLLKNDRLVPGRSDEDVARQIAETRT